MNITIVLGDKIPSIKYGGTQRVMWYLGKELNKRGHKVTFIAGKGSSCPFAKVIELDPSVNLNTQIPTDADIVHFNIPVPEGITKPHLLTIHGNGIPANADRNIVFVSRNHAQRLGSESFVYNGLDWDDYGPANLNLSRKNYHFLGKAAWKVKNIKGAMIQRKKLLLSSQKGLFSPLHGTNLSDLQSLNPYTSELPYSVLPTVRFPNSFHRKSVF